MSQPDAVTRIKNLRLRTLTGIKEEKTANRQDVMVNVAIHYSTDKARGSRDISGTPSYRIITKRIISHLENGRFSLPEKLAQDVLSIACGHHQVTYAEVETDKLHTLHYADSMSVTMSRRRQQCQGGSMKTLLTGDTDLVGRYLIPRLLELGHSIMVSTRYPDSTHAHPDPRVTLWRDLEGHYHLNNTNIVIGLTGEPIADRRWMAEQKQRLCHNCWDFTQRLVDLVHASDTPLSALISGSATGCYGDLGKVVVIEKEPPHNEFTYKLCARWEQIACEAQSERTHVRLLRTGVVLAPRDGALGKITPVFKLSLGGSIDSGRQYLAWIYIDDMVNDTLQLLDNGLRGPFNIISPYSMRSEQFAHALGHALNRPATFRVPAAATRLLMGESVVPVFGDQHVLPKRLEAAGFAFRRYDLEEVLKGVLR